MFLKCLNEWQYEHYTYLLNILYLYIPISKPYLYIRIGKPVVTQYRKTVGARKESSTTINVQFYSNNDSDAKVQWYQSINGETRNITEPRFTWRTNETDVNLTIYGHTVIQPGFITTLSVINIQIGDFKDYIFEIRNDVGKTTAQVTLRAQGNIS